MGKFTQMQSRGHRDATRKAMTRMTYRCPSCHRGQNRNPIDISGVGDLLWVCVYCEHTWMAGERFRATIPTDPSSDAAED